MTFRFDFNSGRYAVGERELHCGDCFQMEVDGKWLDVRIEHTNQVKPPHSGWYLIGTPRPSANWADLLEGLPARMYD